jgi:CheY-like chemotaxis protein
LDFKKLVLVADDATFICQMIEKLLTPAGYRVICADDGLMALKMAKEHHPDIIILDLLMPRMTGFDVLRELKKNDATRDTPVLVMSGVYTNTREIGFIQGLGAAGFIHKDALDENLIFRVNTLLQVPAT